MSFFSAFCGAGAGAFAAAAGAAGLAPDSVFAAGFLLRVSALVFLTAQLLMDGHFRALFHQGRAALILIITAAALWKHRKSFSAGMQAGCALTGLCLLASLIWGIADFGNLFTAFHRLFFTNDGWLLDPRTDLLIRLMPTAFFVNMGIRVLLAVTAMALLAFAAARMIRRTEDKEEDQGGTGRCISGEPRVMNDGL